MQFLYLLFFFAVVIFIAFHRTVFSVICMHYVESHVGNISIQSIKKVSSDFFSLPLLNGLNIVFWYIKVRDTVMQIQFQNTLLDPDQFESQNRVSLKMCAFESTQDMTTFLFRFSFTAPIKYSIQKSVSEFHKNNVLQICFTLPHYRYVTIDINHISNKKLTHPQDYIFTARVQTVGRIYGTYTRVTENPLYPQ